MKITLFFIVITILSVSIHAESEHDIYGDAWIVPGYDSMISLKDMDQNRLESEGKFFERTGFSFNWMSDKFFAGTTGEFFLVPAGSEYSRIDTDISGGMFLYKNDWEFSGTLVYHYAAYDFDKLHSYFSDVFFYGDLFYYHSDQFSSYLSLKTGFYKSHADIIDYLTGPSVGLEIGEYYYPGGERDVIRAGASATFTFFKKEENIPYSLSDESFVEITRENNAMLLEAFIKSKFFFKSFFIYFAGTYFHDYRLKQEIRDTGHSGKKKRRIDKRFLLETEFGKSFSEVFELLVRYNGSRNFSSLDASEEDLDYINWNYSRHMFELSMRINY